MVRKKADTVEWLRENGLSQVLRSMGTGASGRLMSGQRSEEM
jgi:hypothetical protein